MIVDPSVIISVIQHEHERQQFLAAFDGAAVRRMSAGSWIELSAVVNRRKLIDPDHLNGLLEPLCIEVTPLTEKQAEIGHAAYRRFGLGTGHRARLNFGDCFSYALAIATGEPLLFKGDDFNHTDVRRHEASSYPR